MEVGSDVSLALEVLPPVVRLLAQATAAAPDGLGPMQNRLLKRLARTSWLTCELAAELDVTAATVSAAVDGLVRRGLVERQPRPAGDRRAIPLAATLAGREALAAARARQEAALQRVLAGMTGRERRALGAGLRGLAAALRLPAGEAGAAVSAGDAVRSGRREA